MRDIEIIRSGFEDARRAVLRLKGRLASMEQSSGERGRELTRRVFGKDLLPRQVVDRIIGDVRRLGDEAVADYTVKLDAVPLTPERFRVGAEEIDAAGRAMPPELLEAVKRAAANIERFQRAALAPEPKPVEADGISVLHRYIPLRRAGIYVPGGSAPLLSTVLMTAIPAKVAGVEEIVVFSPPSRDGNIPDAILGACRETGVEEVYRIGGAQAVAAMAYGTQTIPPVDIIAGPGSVFVTLAKMAVYGRVAIDMPAGPSEVAIVADGSADLRLVALDMLAQAEHYPGSAVVIALDDALCDALPDALTGEAATLERGDQAMECLAGFGLIVRVRSPEEALDLVDLIAPEHLEIMCSDAAGLAARVRNAGAVFVGAFTPTALGDYFAGPSHTLPTGSAARFLSGLSANTFRRSCAVISADKKGLEGAAASVDALARAEGLTAHARSVQARVGKQS